MKYCKCGCGKRTNCYLDHGDHGKIVESDYLSGHNRRGHKASPETIKKLTESHAGKEPWNKGKNLTMEHVENLRTSHAGKPSHRKGVKHSAESIEKMRNSKIGKKMSEKAKLMKANTMKEKWKSQTFAQRMIKAWRLTPNKKEFRLNDILNSLYPGEWKFVGDGQVVINGKCPDFINVNGQKKIIELFGDYWHQGENPDDRAAVFAPFGYETLVIWERELDRITNLNGKLREFCEVK